eukprot:7644787-Pyramimonas_sp.AAC.1
MLIPKEQVPAETLVVMISIEDVADAAALLVLHHSRVGIREAEGGLEHRVPAQRGAAVLADEAKHPEAGRGSRQPP